MSEMVERVATAIEGALPNQMKHLGPLLARAAIEAMREPTAAMEKAAWPEPLFDPPVPTEAWKAMIDAALKG